MDDELFIRPGDGSQRLLSWSLDFSSDAVLNIRNQYIIKVITDANSPDAYLLMSHDSNNSTGLSALEDTPNIGQNISGIWHDPDIPNQGMVVSTGRRADGSEYQFITFYTYRDSQPFWFAGQNEITAPQSSVEIDLYQFQGGGLFSKTDLPEAEALGSLTVRMTGCDTLAASINLHDQPVVDVDLTRIDNTTIEQPCID